jgi:UDP-3-O-[3-hydroxymyristoyl] glucosamine N-acyltransferase
MTLGQLAERYGGSCDRGAEAIVLSHLAQIDLAREGALAPVLASRHAHSATESKASAWLIDETIAHLVPVGRRWTHPFAAWTMAALLDDARRHLETRGEASSAVIVESARIGLGAVVMPGAVVGADSVVGENAVIYAGARLGARVRIGACVVIGAQGFGFARGPNGATRRISHLGGVILEDDVEIGPLSTVDAGTLAPTCVRRGTRIDAHVHVAHNVVIGPDAIVAAQSGFAGSTRIGARVLVGGQAGVADHVTVGDDAKLAAKVVAGYPAVERRRWLRAMARSLRGKR